jgi:hypothetical protein
MPKRGKREKKEQKKKELSGVALWYEEHLRGKFSLVGIFVVFVALAIAYFVGLLPEHLAGMALALMLILVCCGYAGFALLHASRSNLEGALALGLAVLGAVVALGPVVSTLMPGKPVAHGTLSAPGDSLPLPPQVRHIRVLMHAEFGGASASTVDVTLDAGAGGMSGHLERSVSHGRIGRRGQGTMVDEHNSVFMDGDVGGSHVLKLADVKGNAGGGLEVNVFSQWFPFTLLCVAAGLLALFGAGLAGRFGLGAPPAAALGAALVFGIMVYRMATPDTAVRSEVGALMIAGLLGTVGGGTLGWMGRKLLGRRRAS